MNDNQNNENQTNINQDSNFVDPRTVQATVLGELRKDKIGKPMLVVYMFALFIVVLIALPIVSNMLSDDSTILYKIVYGNKGKVDVVDVDEAEPEFLDGSIIQTLNTSKSIKYENLVLSDFVLQGNTIKCRIYSYNGIIDMDNDSYYMEIYSSGNELVGAFKIGGTYDNEVKEVELKAYDISFNSSNTYNGKIVKMEEKDYPKVDIETDESGIGSFVCSDETRNIEYKFKNNYLIGIRDSVRIQKDEDPEKDSIYINILNKYRVKQTALGSTATVEEVSDGLLFTAEFDLENYKVPKSVVDPEYYELNTLATEIHYAMQGKGFGCK